jgi:hypothetical protein
MQKLAAWFRNWFGQWWKWITTGETTLSVGERFLSAFGVSFASSWVTGLLAWVLKNPWYGVWIFLGTFLLVEAVQAVRAYLLPPSETSAEPETSKAGLPVDAKTRQEFIECHFRLIDLLRLAGEDGTIEDKTFRDCTIEGPAVVTAKSKPQREIIRMAVV